MQNLVVGGILGPWFKGLNREHRFTRLHVGASLLAMAVDKPTDV